MIKVDYLCVYTEISKLTFFFVVVPVNSKGTKGPSKVDPGQILQSLPFAT